MVVVCAAVPVSPDSYYSPGAGTGTAAVASPGAESAVVPYSGGHDGWSQEVDSYGNTYWYNATTGVWFVVLVSCMTVSMNPLASLAGESSWYNPWETQALTVGGTADGYDAATTAAVFSPSHGYDGVWNCVCWLGWNAITTLCFSDRHAGCCWRHERRWRRWLGR